MSLRERRPDKSCLSQLRRFGGKFSHVVGSFFQGVWIVSMLRVRIDHMAHENPDPEEEDEITQIIAMSFGAAVFFYRLYQKFYRPPLYVHQSAERIRQIAISAVLGLEEGLKVLVFFGLQEHQPKTYVSMIAIAVLNCLGVALDDVADRPPPEDEDEKEAMSAAEGNSKINKMVRRKNWQKACFIFFGAIGGGGLGSIFGRLIEVSGLLSKEVSAGVSFGLTGLTVLGGAWDSYQAHNNIKYNNFKLAKAKEFGRAAVITQLGIIEFSRKFFGVFSSNSSKLETVLLLIPTTLISMGAGWGQQHLISKAQMPEIGADRDGFFDLLTDEEEQGKSNGSQEKNRSAKARSPSSSSSSSPSVHSNLLSPARRAADSENYSATDEIAAPLPPS